MIIDAKLFLLCCVLLCSFIQYGFMVCARYCRFCAYFVWYYRAWRYHVCILHWNLPWPHSYDSLTAGTVFSTQFSPQFTIQTIHLQNLTYLHILYNFWPASPAHLVLGHLNWWTNFKLMILFVLLLQNSMFSVIVICHIDRYISAVLPKESIEKYQALSHCCQSHPQSTHQAPSRFCTMSLGYILRETLLKVFWSSWDFLTPLAGASGVKGMFEFDKWFSWGGKVAAGRMAILLGWATLEGKPMKILLVPEV